MYGRRKITRYLRRQGHGVAFCTVDRLMREAGSNGVVKGRKHRTMIPAKDGIRSGAKVNRNFTAAALNHVWVAGFTYVSTWIGWAYVAFVFDAFSRAIVGWAAGEFEDGSAGYQGTQHSGVAARPLWSSGRA
ncbi:IS3 family transposase [Haloechinothrix sp. YIM 98757]|uniref:IS3 family transposase n=1 Tax=Haloechinothrix aidingensis TaxID=2752311 RepID=A0A838ABW1_9PSEU|nr:IS3 family transposase [Haloechinothrix aidingensis]